MRSFASLRTTREPDATQDEIMTPCPAEILREYGPFPGANDVHGLTFDGQHVWFASGDRLNAFDPESGMIVRTIDANAHAGTAFDGRHLFQLFEKRIQKIEIGRAHV